MGGGARAEKRRYFTAERREAYLDCLRVTASYRAAAREAGVSERAARRYRERHPDYDALCGQAELEARRRLAGAEGAFDGPLDATFESIRRGPKGEAKIVKSPGGRWTIKVEERFFAVLGMTGNIAAAARAVGFSREAIGQRRRKWPALARRMEEMMEEAEIDLEFRLLGIGTGWSEGAEAEREAAADEVAPPPPFGWFPSPANAGEDKGVAFDPEFALRFLKWREEKRRGRRAGLVAFPKAEEARERIIAKVMAIKRHEAMMAKRRAAEGDEGEFGGEAS